MESFEGIQVAWQTGLVMRLAKAELKRGPGEVEPGRQSSQ
jgi:hypothetical protein